MQARLDEEAGQLVQLWQNIGQEWAGRALAGEARHLPQDVQHRIIDDARARLPPASSGVGQNLAAAACDGNLYSNHAGNSHCGTFYIRKSDH